MELSPKKSALLGLGLDNDDGHLRMTRGKNFHLIGGSQDTHDAMQEKCIKFNEKLDIKGKQLENLDSEEFLEMAEECQINVISPTSKKSKN